MLSNLKVYAGIAITAAFSILFAMFKYKSGKLEETKDKLRNAKAEIEAKRIQKEIDIKVQRDYVKRLDAIGEKYDIEEREVYKNADAPLSPSLLERLRRKQGVSSNSDTPSP